MKAETQHNPELAKVCELIQYLPVAMLTGVDADGALTSRPMSPLEMDAAGAIWFFTDRRSTKVEHLDVLNLAFSDADHSTYVSLSGHGELDSDRLRIDRLWTPFAKPWFPDGPGSLHLALLKFVPRSAEYWDAPNSKMVRMFAMAASVVAGKPIGLGDPGTLQHLETPLRNVA